MQKKPGIIAAVDVAEFTPELRRTLEDIATHVEMFKIGLQSIFTEEIRYGKTVARQIREFVTEKLKKDVFLDAKLHEVHSTTIAAITAIAQFAPRVVSAHAPMSNAALSGLMAITKALDPKVTVALVTVPTDISDEECDERYKAGVKTVVSRFAALGYRHGFRSFVCAVSEVKDLRTRVDPLLRTFCPGIIPKRYTGPTTQMRTATPAEATKAGVDYVIIGKAIFNQAGMTPLEAILRIDDEMAEAAV